MALTNEDLQEIAKLLQPMQKSITDMQENMTGMKNNISDIQKDMTDMRNNITDMQEDMTDMRNNISDTQNNITDIKLTLENVTNKNIQLIAENHVELVNKLNQAIPVANNNLVYEVKVNFLVEEVEKLKKEVSDLKEKIA